MEEPPPPPPPHGEKSRRKPGAGGLPDGKYDIFVIPPSSAGSGFLYLPSLQTQRNSFLAGCLCTALAFFFYSVAMPVAKEWFHRTVNKGGPGIAMLMAGTAVIAWIVGKIQAEGFGASPFGDKSSSRTHSNHSRAEPSPESRHRDSSPPRPESPPTPEAGTEFKPGYKSGSGPEAQPKSREEAKPTDTPKSAPQSPQSKPKSTWQRPQPSTEGKSAWEKAREETRKREEERKRQAEIQRRREQIEREREELRLKQKEEKLEREWKEKKALEEAARRKAEEELANKNKVDLDQKAQREKEARERIAREALLKAAQEAREAKQALEAKEKEIREREAVEAAKAAKADSSTSKRPPMPSARTARDDDAYSFRPYDRPRTEGQKSSAGSVYSDDSYAPSATTAKTTPPGSTRGPYTTKDPDKIIIKGVYSFNNAFMRTPISQLISGQGNVTDGLILRITTEGLFIDDDVRGVFYREWDVKAWTLKLAETIEYHGHHLLRASIRDQEGKKYVFIVNQSEGWKVAVGLQRLRKGSQVRALNIAGLPQNEARMLLETLGWNQ